jgi:hypothetical protein
MLPATARARSKCLARSASEAPFSDFGSSAAARAINVVVRSSSTSSNDKRNMPTPPRRDAVAWPEVRKGNLKLANISDIMS